MASVYLQVVMLLSQYGVLRGLLSMEKSLMSNTESVLLM